MKRRKVRWLALIQLYGQASLMAFQFLSVAFFLAAWGAAQYGEWLLLTSVPLFFAQLSVGYGAAACPIMARALHEDRSGDASAAFLTALLATSAVVAIFVFLVVAVFVSGAHPIPAHGPISGKDAYVVIATGFLIACVSLYNGDIYASFYAADHQPLGDFLLNSMFVIDNIVTLLALAVFKAQPVELALALGVERLATSAAYSATSFLCCRPLWQFRSVTLPALRMKYAELRKPAGGYFLEPISNILQNQGLVFVTGTIAGPVAAAVMHSHRLLGRVSWQVMSAIRAITNREVLRLYATGDEQKGRVASKLVLSVYFWLAFVCSAGLFILGPTFTKYWLHGRLTFNLALFETFIAAGFFTSLVFGFRAVMQVNNNHANLARLEFGLTALTVMLVAASLYMGLPIFIVGCALVLLYFTCFWIALSQVSRLLNEPMLEILRGAIVAAPSAALWFARHKNLRFGPAQ